MIKHLCGIQVCVLREAFGLQMLVKIYIYAVHHWILFVITEATL